MRHQAFVPGKGKTGKHKRDKQGGVPNDYYPNGPFIGELDDGGAFDAAREDFLLDVRTLRTARAYRADLDDFKEWCRAEGVEPLDPAPSDFVRYKGSLGDRGYSPGTIARRLSAVRGFFRHLAGLGSTS